MFPVITCIQCGHTHGVICSVEKGICNCPCHIRQTASSQSASLPPPAPLESTPWLVHAEQMNPPYRCNCGSAYEEFRVVRENGKWKHKCRCGRCGEPVTRGLVECADEKPPATNAVHERLGTFATSRRNGSTWEWCVSGLSVWQPCPCDSCAKARGE